MNEGALRVDEEDVRNPDLLHQPGVEGAAQVVPRGKSQTLVFPVVPQVERHGEVLKNKQEPNSHQHSEPRIQMLDKNSGQCLPC